MRKLTVAGTTPRFRTTRPSLPSRGLTYAPVGTTVDDDSWWIGSRAGFRSYDRTVPIGSGVDVWQSARTRVLRWTVKTRSGFDVEPDEPHAATPVRPVGLDENWWLIARIGPLRVREPVRVVAVVDEPDRVGFAYGTLDGHPVSGEDAFLVTRRDDGSVWLTVRSLSRPGSRRWRLAYPAVLVAQRWYRARYLRALR